MYSKLIEDNPFNVEIECYLFKYVWYNFYGDKMNTIVYFIRHSKANNMTHYSNKSLLEKNKRQRLSTEGHLIAQELSKKKEFQNFDVVISSDYDRAIQTALYFVNDNQKILIKNKFGERIHGVEDYSLLPTDYEKKQFEDPDFKVGRGESQKEVSSRMYKGLVEVLETYKFKKIAIVSHSTAISFLLTRWCEVNYDGNYKFNNKIFFDGIWEPCTTFKIVFDENKEIIDIKQIGKNYESNDI